MFGVVEFGAKSSYLAGEYCADHKSPYITIDPHAAVRYASTFPQMLSLVHESDLSAVEAYKILQ